MNGTAAAITAFFAKMTPLHWLTSIVLVIGMIVYGGITYFQVGDNTENIKSNKTKIEEIHDTQIILVEEMRHLNEGQSENTELLRAWMEKLYDQAVTEDTR